MPTWTAPHIRTLLLTFFYRQMRELIEQGHVFIAQPPLYRAKRGRTEHYIKDDHELEAYLIRRSSESRMVRVPETGGTYSGEELEGMLRRLMAFQRLLQVVERRGPSPDVVKAVLESTAPGIRMFFADRGRVEVVGEGLVTEDRAVTVADDEEHDACVLVVDDRRNGFPRRHTGGRRLRRGGGVPRAPRTLRRDLRLARAAAGRVPRVGRPPRRPLPSSDPEGDCRSRRGRSPRRPALPPATSA